MLVAAYGEGIKRGSNACVYYSSMHACSVDIVHACFASRVNTGTKIIVHACTQVRVPACTVAIVHAMRYG